MARILIHIPKPGQDFASWGILTGDQASATSTFGAGTLEEAAAAATGHRCTVAIGSGAITITSATVPGSGGKRARAAIPFALEEQLADDVEDLHFAIGPAGSEGEFPVAVIAREAMEQLMDSLTTAGIYPMLVVPDVMLLPQGDADEWQVLLTEQDMLIRQSTYTGMWCPAPSAEMMLGRMLRELGVENGPAQVSFYLCPDQEAPEVDTLIEHILVENTADALVRGIDGQHINLLQGEFNQSEALGKAWKPWKVPAALAAGLVGLSIAGSVLESNRLEAQESDQRAQMQSILKQTFPSIKRSRDPMTRMRSELNKLKKGGGDGQLMTLVAALSEAVKSAPSTTMNSINFRNGRCDVELKTNTLQTLDQIKQTIEAQNGIKASIQSANQQDGAVRGRLRIEAG